MKHFSENLKRARQLKGWYQKQAAHSIGISLKTLGAYEEGRCYAPLEVFVRICKAYSITDPVLFVTGAYFSEDKGLTEAVESLSWIERQYQSADSRTKRAIDVLLEMG